MEDPILVISTKVGIPLCNASFFRLPAFCIQSYILSASDNE